MRTEKDVINRDGKKEKNNANREYTVVVYAFLVLFLALIGFFVYSNVFQSDRVINNNFNKPDIGCIL